MNSLKLRGKEFTNFELQIIRTITKEYYQQGRTKISKVVCEILDWKQPNGWLKDRACRDVLRTLDEKRIINLPPPKLRTVVKTKEKRTPNTLSIKQIKQFDFSSQMDQFPGDISLLYAKGNKFEEIWNYIVDKHHYLGHKVAVGRNIKYLIISDTKLLGAICFSSPSWQLATRDTLLYRLGITNPRDFTINNSRFLLLPNIKVKNLASYVLSLSTKKIVSDWSRYYSITPLIAETFVQPSLFTGTCYKAANWYEIGKTKGFAKKGASYRNSQEPKIIFLYGLNSEIRKQLAKIMAEGNNGDV